MRSLLRNVFFATTLLVTLCAFPHGVFASQIVLTSVGDTGLINFDVTALNTENVTSATLSNAGGSIAGAIEGTTSVFTGLNGGGDLFRVYNTFIGGTFGLGNGLAGTAVEETRTLLENGVFSILYEVTAGSGTVTLSAPFTSTISSPDFEPTIITAVVGEVADDASTNADVPAPATLALIGLGLLGLRLRRRA